VGLLDAWASSPDGSLRLLARRRSPRFHGADTAPTRSPAQILVVHGTSAKCGRQVFRETYGG